MSFWGWDDRREMVGDVEMGVEREVEERRGVDMVSLGGLNGYSEAEQ